MSRVYLELVNNEWKEVSKSNFWIDRYLYNYLRQCDKILKKKWDAFVLVDGKEGSGKSRLAMTMAWFISRGKLTINNFAKGLDDAGHKIEQLPDGSVLIFDEGGLIFDARSSSGRQQVAFKKLLEVVRQKNMFFVVVLPSFFELQKQIAIRRSLWLCHVYPDDEYNRGQFVLWGERGKKTLYIEGKKNQDSYKFPSPDFPPAEFMDFEPPFIRDYEDRLKRESLAEAIKLAKDSVKGASLSKLAETEAIIYGYLKEIKGFKVEELMEIKNQSRTTIYDRIRLYESLNEK